MFEVQINKNTMKGWTPGTDPYLWKPKWWKPEWETICAFETLEQAQEQADKTARAYDGSFSAVRIMLREKGKRAVEVGNRPAIHNPKIRQIMEGLLYEPPDTPADPAILAGFKRLQKDISRKDRLRPA